ncbi:MAG: Flp family type IVb pilin, partial [Methylomonas sp.]
SFEFIGTPRKTQNYSEIGKVMQNLKAFIINLFRREEGASALEYALLAAMVAVVIAGFVPTISAKITTIFQTISTAL